MTNSLPGLGRPVGKGPRRLPRKPSTTPGGAALFTCGSEANKLYGKMGRFPAEMRVCEPSFHCVHWKKIARNNIIFVGIGVSRPGNFCAHFPLFRQCLFFFETGPFPITKSGHLRNQKLLVQYQMLQFLDARCLVAQ